MMGGLLGGLVRIQRHVGQTTLIAFIGRERARSQSTLAEIVRIGIGAVLLSVLAGVFTRIALAPIWHNTEADQEFFGIQILCATLFVCSAAGWLHFILRNPGTDAAEPPSDQQT